MIFAVGLLCACPRCFLAAHMVNTMKFRPVASGVNLLGTKAQRRGTRADVLPMAAGSNLVTDDCSKSSVHAMAGSA